MFNYFLYRKYPPIVNKEPSDRTINTSIMVAEFIGKPRSRMIMIF